MKNKLLEIINTIKSNNDQELITSISSSDLLRDDLGFSSLDLAELTVRIESEFGVDVFSDGLVETIEEVEKKISNA